MQLQVGLGVSLCKSLMGLDGKEAHAQNCYKQGGIDELMVGDPLNDMRHLHADGCKSVDLGLLLTPLLVCHGTVLLLSAFVLQGSSFQRSGCHASRLSPGLDRC